MSRAHSKTNLKSSRITYRVEPEVVTSLDDTAKQQGLTRSKLVRLAIQQYLKTPAA